MPNDKQRLDWLQKNRALLDASCYGDKNSIVVVQPCAVVGTGVAKTVREAIDKAMAKK